MYTDGTDPVGAVRTVPCVNAGLCLGGGPQGTQCDPSRMQTSNNVECATCDAGLSEWNNQCLQCSGVNGGLVILVIVLSWAYVLLTHKLSQDSSSLTSGT